MSADNGTRINKYLSEAGVCSRREADRLIAAGEVRINGRRAVPGDRVTGADRVEYAGQQIRPQTERILLAMHKPRGIVCTTDRREPDNIIDYTRYPKRIYTVGRLDKDSEGLILLTNCGDLVNRIMRAGNYHEKEYVVTVDRPVTAEFLEKMRGGVYLPELDVTTRSCRVIKSARCEFHIILTQGYNRQIRRMCEACGCSVRRLVRIRVMNIELGDLKAGAYRPVTAQELAVLKELLIDSRSDPMPPLK